LRPFCFVTKFKFKGTVFTHFTEAVPILTVKDVAVAVLIDPSGPNFPAAQVAAEGQHARNVDRR